MKSKAFFVSIFLIVSLFLPLYQISKVKAQEGLDILELVCDKDFYYLKGETMQIKAFSNASISVTLSVYWNWKTFSDNELVYRNTKTMNATWNLPTQNQKVGFYKIVANTSEATVTIWRTLLHTTSYVSESLPFSYVWKGINYTLKGRTLTAYNGEDYINITYPKIPFKHRTRFYRNNMTFVVRLDNQSQGWAVDWTYATVHMGLKWIVNGTLDNPKTFEFKLNHNPVVTWKKKLDSFRSESNLVLDWDDLRKAKKAFTWNATTKTLHVEIPSSFSIDPAIFEDGFESGNFTAWTGTVETGTTVSVISNGAHHGTYMEEIDDLLLSSRRGFCYKTLASSYSDLYMRAYVQLDSKPSTASWYDMGVNLYGADTNNLLVKAIFNTNTNKWGLRARVGGAWVVYYESGTSTVDADTWYCVEVRGYVHATAGILTLWVDGVQKLSQTSIDTDDRGNLQVVSAGYDWIESSLDANLIMYVDCVVVDDAYIGPEAAGEAYVSDLSQSVSIAWSILTEWDAIADITQSLTSSWSVLTEWDAILDVTQALTTTWNILANLNTFVDLSQAIATTWVILTQWNAILDLAQSLTTSWTVLTQTNFNIIASLSNTFTWLVDIIHTVGGVAYIADLSQAITTTWTILTQWNGIIDLTQSLSTTWTVLIQSTFNIATSLSNTFTWTVDVLKGVITDHIVDLTLTVVTSWIIDVIHTPWTTIYATKGFVLATIMLGLLIGTPLLAIIIWRKKQ